LATETYEKYKKNQNIYDSRANIKDSSIFVSPSFKQMERTGLGLSTGIGVVAVQEPSTPPSPPTIVVPPTQKRDIFFLQNPTLNDIFPLNSIRLNFRDRVDPKHDLNRLFDFV
jgi:hypothetical protein